MDLLQPPTQMTRTGNEEEIFTTWFQKFGLYFVVSEKTTKLNHVKYALVLHVDREKAVEVYNALTFIEAEKSNYNSLVRKFTKFVVLYCHLLIHAEI